MQFFFRKILKYFPGKSWFLWVVSYKCKVFLYIYSRVKSGHTILFFFNYWREWGREKETSMWMRNPIHCFLCVPCHPASSWCKGLCYTQLKAGAFLPYQPGPLLPYFPMRIIIRMAINEIMTCSIKSQVMLKKNKEIKNALIKDIQVKNFI